MKKLSAWSILICLALFCAACTPAAPQTTPGAASAPTQTATAAPAATPTQVLTTPPAASLTPVQTAASNAQIDAESYLPQENIRITTLQYVGQGASERVSYVYGSFDDIDDTTYRVTGFAEDQPIFYTDYFIDEEGLWAQFSDDAGEGKYMVLPREITIGAEFDCRGAAAQIVDIGADIDLNGYIAQDCVIVQLVSTAYSTDVYYAFQENRGKIAEYILYDDNVIDVVSVTAGVEDLSQQQVDQIIAGSSL